MRRQLYCQHRDAANHIQFFLFTQSPNQARAALPLFFSQNSFQFYDLRYMKFWICFIIQCCYSSFGYFTVLLECINKLQKKYSYSSHNYLDEWSSGLLVKQYFNHAVRLGKQICALTEVSLHILKLHLLLVVQVKLLGVRECCRINILKSIHWSLILTFPSLLGTDKFFYPTGDATQPKRVTPLNLNEVTPHPILGSPENGAKLQATPEGALCRVVWYMVFSKAIHECM